MKRDESSWKHGLAHGSSFPPRPSLQKLPRNNLPRRRRVLNPKQVRDNTVRETNGRLTRLPSAVTREHTAAFKRTFPRVEASHGNALTRRPVCRSNDAQKPRFHDRGGAVPDARNWSHHWNLHGRECRAPAAAAVRAPRTTHSNLHGISNVPERGTPPLLDVRARISGSSPGYPFLGLTRSVDHQRSESGGKNATRAGHGGLRERRAPGNACRSANPGAPDIAIGRCTRS